MNKKDYPILTACLKGFPWILGAACRFVTGLFSPPLNAPNYYYTFFDFHVSPVSYILAILMTVVSVVFSIISIGQGDFIRLLLSLISVAFGICLIYACCKRKPAFYLPALISMHAFVICGLAFVSIRIISMISELNNNIDRGFRYGGEKNETLIAKIFYYQMTLVGLCFVGYLSNIVFRDYDFVKGVNKLKIEAVKPLKPAEVKVKTEEKQLSELEAKQESEESEVAGVPHLYV